MTGTVDLNPNHLATVEAILAEHVPECEVRAFGSRATWTARDYSDLDLAVVGEGPLDWQTLSRLKEALEESDLPMRVDVLDWHATSESFREVIERDYVVLWEEAKQPTAIHWTEVTLGDVCTKIGSGATPRGGKAVYLEDGPYALIRSQNVYNAGFARDGLAFISDAHAEALHNVEVLPDDVLLNITGDSVARVCQVDRLVLPARVNQHVAIIRTDPDRLDSGYLRYYLAAPEVQSMLLSWAGSGGTRNALTKRMIETFVVQAPADLAEQRAIAHVLGTLDDKIELNRRMNETLEEIARALFKSWFVDFEPVRAKMDGRWRRGESLPGLPSEHYDLFPNRLVPSELGDIPEGWDVGKFSDIVAQLRDNENPATSPDTVFSHFSIPAHDEGQMPIRELGGNIKSSKSRVPHDVVLLSKLNPETERVWLVDVTPGERAICSTEFLVLRASPPFRRSYVYCLARSPLFRREIESLVTGTSKSHQRAPAGAILALHVAMPPARLIEAFEMSASELLRRSVALRRESRALAAQRDALLPKLMSGEVRVGKRRYTDNECN